MKQLNVPAETEKILTDLLGQNYVEVEAGTIFTQEMAAALLSLLEQVGNIVIGKDETVQYLNDQPVVITNPEVTAFTDNKLKAAQRQTLNALLKGEKDG